MPQSSQPDLRPTADELATKRRQLVALCEAEDLAAVLLTLESSVAWATGGGVTRVVIGGGDAAALMLITRAGEAFVLVDAIEAPRIAAEEMPEQGVHMRVFPWEEDRDAHRALLVREIVGTGAVGTDAPFPALPQAPVIAAQVRALRSSLMDGEIVRYRWLAQATAHAVEDAARTITPGMTEHAITAAFVGPLVAAGIQAPVALVATDARISSYRHPLPTEQVMRTQALLVATGVRWGLHASVSRAVSFGPMSDDLQRRQHACAAVDEAYISATRVGATGAEIFAAGVAAYAAAGFPGEWRLHHQGGATGYAGREWLLTPTTAERVQARQAFAYNPSVTGTKSEDTFMLRADGTPDFLTVTGDWPTVPNSGACSRPAILERD